MSTHQRLSVRHLLAYATPGIALSLLIPPFPALMAAFYAKYTAATLGGIATTLLLARLIDAFVDPAIGYLSDITKTRIGGRKPWMLAGAAVGMIAFYVLFLPAETSGDFAFFVGMTLYYIALAMIDIPMRAWSGEITQDYGERSRIAGYLTTSLLVGGVLFMVLPEVLSLPALGLAKTSALDRNMIGLFGVIGMVILPISVLWSVMSVPTGNIVVPTQKHSFRELLFAFRSNKPFWIFLIADALTQVGFGAFYAVMFVALDSYFQIGDKVPIFILCVIAIQILAVPVVTRLSSRYGKHHVWAWAWVLHTALLPLVLLFEPGKTDYILFTIFACCLSIFQTPQMMLPMSMLSDIADYDTLKSGRNRSGIYFAVRMLSFKGLYAVGGSVGFFVLKTYGYNPKIVDNTADAQVGMLIAMALIPGVCILLSSVFLFVYPLNARRHAIIRRRIERRELAAKRLVPAD